MAVKKRVSKPKVRKHIAEPEAAPPAPPAPVEEAPPVVKMYYYKNREVASIRIATPADSGYMEGQDQVVVTFKDTGALATAWRADLQPIYA